MKFFIALMGWEGINRVFSKPGRRAEIIGTAAVSAVTVTLIGVVVWILISNRVCPWWILFFWAFSPLLISKLPSELHYYLWDEYPRSPENEVRGAAITGGCLSIIFIVVTAFCGLVLLWLWLVHTGEFV